MPFSAKVELSLKTRWDVSPHPINVNSTLSRLCIEYTVAWFHHCPRAKFDTPSVSRVTFPSCMGHVKLHCLFQYTHIARVVPWNLWYTLYCVPSSIRLVGCFASNELHRLASSAFDLAHSIYGYVNLSSAANGFRTWALRKNDSKEGEEKK